LALNGRASDVLFSAFFSLGHFGDALNLYA